MPGEGSGTALSIGAGTLIDLKNLKRDSDSGKLRVLPRREKREERLTFRRWRWAWAALLPVLLVAGFFAWRAWRAPESTEPLRAVPLTTLPGVQRYPSFSPDGNHVAFTWTGPKQDNHDIYVQQIGAGSPLRLTTDPSNDYNPVWSPDGRWIAFLRSQSEAGKSELRLIPPLGGPERKLAEIRVRESLRHSAVPCLVSGQQLSGCYGLPGRGQAGRLVRGFARDRREKAVDQSAAPCDRATPTRRSLPTAVGWSSAGTPAACSLVSFTGFRWEEA